MPLPIPPVAQQDRSRRTSRVLLRAGAELLREKGYDGLTIAALSDRAGVAAGTIYRRFGDKNGLLAALQKDFTADFQAAFARRIGRTSTAEGLTADQAIRAAVGSMGAFAREQAALLRVFIVLGLHDERVHAVGNRAARQDGELFRAVLSPHRGAFARPDPDQALKTAYRLVYSSLLHRIVFGAEGELSADVTWDELIEELSTTVALQLLGRLPEAP